MGFFMSNDFDAAPKRLKKLTISLTDSDVTGLRACINLDPMFPPDPCELLCVIARDGIARLLQGESQLVDIYRKFGKRDLSEVLARYDEPRSN